MGITNRLLVRTEIDADVIAALKAELKLARSTCLALMESQPIYWCLSDEQGDYLASLGAGAQVATYAENNPEISTGDAPSS